MERVSADQIELFLQDYGWTFQPASENCWHTGWQGEKRSYPMTIRISDTWVLLQVNPLMKLGVDWASWPEISKYLLERNHDLHLAKLGIDEFGEVCLSLQVFNQGVNFDLFADCLGVLGHYAEMLYDELWCLLQDSGFFNYQNSEMLSS